MSDRDPFMMKSSNGNIFRVTGHLSGEFTGPGEFPTQRPVTRSFDVFFDLRLNKRLSKQSRWSFETLSRLLWRHSNVIRGDVKPGHVLKDLTCLYVLRLTVVIYAYCEVNYELSPIISFVLYVTGGLIAWQARHHCHSPCQRFCTVFINQLCTDIVNKISMNITTLDNYSHNINGYLQDKMGLCRNILISLPHNWRRQESV